MVICLAVPFRPQINGKECHLFDSESGISSDIWPYIQYILVHEDLFHDRIGLIRFGPIPDGLLTHVGCIIFHFRPKVTSQIVDKTFYFSTTAPRHLLKWTIMQQVLPRRPRLPTQIRPTACRLTTKATPLCSLTNSTTTILRNAC